MRCVMTLLLACCWLLRAGIAAAQEPIDAAQLKQLEALERAILYHPRKYRPGDVELFERQGGKRLKFNTSLGEQSGWLIRQTAGAKPEKLWAICGGNGTVALDLAPFVRSLSLERDAFVLIDYPGYGECQGQPSPQGIRDNVKLAIQSAAEQLALGNEKLPEQVCVFGHSLGASAALLAADELKLRSAVLVAPFTSTREVAQAKFALPKSIPVQHSFDNRETLKSLTGNKGRAWIFHGDRDDVIPVAMSQKLGEEFSDSVKLTIVSGGRHNDLLRISKNDIRNAMLEARK